MRGRWKAVGLAVAVIIGYVVWMHVLVQRSDGPAGDPAVGVLLRGGKPFCTAAVVDSPRGDVILTSAHCLSQNPVRIRFAPGYHDGSAPYGTWAVETDRAFPPGWFPGGKISLDFAFVFTTADVQHRVGGLKLGYSLPVPARVTVDGYEPGGALTACTARVRETVKAGTGQLVFDCAGYQDVSSGGPFLSRGRIIGVIGGYQQGGDSPDVSYSSLFGAAVHRLYQHVAGQAPGR
jgi:Trypsin